MPIDEISHCAADIFKREGRVLFQYGHYSATAVAPVDRRSVRGDFEQVLIGNSSMEFLTFIGGVLLKPGDTVWLENPSYDRAITAMRRLGARVVGFPWDPTGLIWMPWRPSCAGRYRSFFTLCRSSRIPRE